MSGKSSMRRRFAAALAALLGLSLAACGGPELPDGASESATNPEAAVYFLNPDPDLDGPWQELAAAYTQKAGVPVKVVSPEAGNYEAALTAEMRRIEAPTLFSLSGPAALDSWGDYAWDLAGSEPLALLIAPALAPEREGQVLALPYDLGVSGLLVNLPLLEQAGHGVTELGTLEGLRAAAEDITARREELGFAAFASPEPAGTEQPGTAGLLGELALWVEDTEAEGSGAECLRALWELMANNGTCAPEELGGRAAGDGAEEFGKGQAVFCVTGDRSYASIRQALPETGLAVLPLPTGTADEAGLSPCLTVRAYWCLNKDADLNDLDATLDFLAWCTGSEEGAGMLSAMGYVLPYQDLPAPENPFSAQALEALAGGKLPVLCPGESAGWESGLYEALAAWSAGGDWESAAAALPIAIE